MLRRVRPRTGLKLSRSPTATGIGAHHVTELHMDLRALSEQSLTARFEASPARLRKQAVVCPQYWQAIPDPSRK